MTQQDPVQPGWRSEVIAYLKFVLAIVRPGHQPTGFSLAPDGKLDVGDLKDWKGADVDALIEEGRRKLDAQAERFDRIRSTAQVVLSLSTGLMVIIGRTMIPIVAKSGWEQAVYLAAWGAALGMVSLAGLGSAALLVVRATFGSILPSLLSQSTPPVAKVLAIVYAEQVATGEHTINTRLTLQWWSVLFLTLGGALYMIVWIVLNATA